MKLLPTAVLICNSNVTINFPVAATGLQYAQPTRVSATLFSRWFVPIDFEKLLDLFKTDQKNDYFTEGIDRVYT